MSIPTRTLGRTGLVVPILGLGTGPGGFGLPDRRAARLYHRAIDRGVTYIDTAPGYGRAHLQLRGVLSERRSEVVLATKAPVSGYDEALESLEGSLRDLGVEQVDIAFVHSMGGREVEEVTGPRGSLAGLAEAKRRGWTRFIGFTAHLETGKSARALGLFDVDVITLAMSFADRYIYGFENEVLPEARERGVGVVCMKAYGGARAMKYEHRCPSAFCELMRKRESGSSLEVFRSLGRGFMSWRFATVPGSRGWRASSRGRIRCESSRRMWGSPAICAS